MRSMLGQWVRWTRFRGENPQRLRHRLVERQGRLAPARAQPVLRLHRAGVVLGDEREHRAPLVGDLPAQDRGHRALAVEVDDEHAVAVERRGHREMRGRRGLARPALEVRDRHDLRRQPLGAPGQVGLGRRALRGEIGAQRHHLLEREPARARLALALRQLGMRLQDAPKMGGRHRDHVARDLPQREPPQALAAVGRVAAAREVVAPLGAVGRGLGEARRVHGRPEARGHRRRVEGRPRLAGRGGVAHGASRGRCGGSTVSPPSSHIAWPVRSANRAASCAGRGAGGRAGPLFSPREGTRRTVRILADLWSLCAAQSPDATSFPGGIAPGDGPAGARIRAHGHPRAGGEAPVRGG